MINDSAPNNYQHYCGVPYYDYSTLYPQTPILIFPEILGPQALNPVENRPKPQNALRNCGFRSLGSLGLGV